MQLLFIKVTVRNVPRGIRFSTLILIGLMLTACDTTPKKQIGISDLSWKAESGGYVISFQAVNHTEKALEAQVKINLQQRIFAGGSPKAEIIESVGKMTVWVPLDPGQSITVTETLPAQKPGYKIDFITIDLVDVEIIKD